MKKSLVGLLAVSLVMFLAGSASAVTVSMCPSSQTVGNSEVLTVDLLVSDVVGPGVDTLNFVLRFDEGLITATGASYTDVVFMGTTFADFFVNIDAESYSTFGPELDNVNGEISFTLWNVGSLGAIGSGTIATMTFVSDASNSGTSALDYTSWLLEPSTGKQITDNASTGDNVIVGSGEGPVIPEPATLLLLAAGMAALGGYARKKKS